MNLVELPEELITQFEDVKNRLLLRLRNIEPTGLQRYGGSMVELYPESLYFPGEGPDYHGALYLMANGEFVDRSMLQGYPFPATADRFVFHYIMDRNKRFTETYHRAEEDYRKRHLSETGLIHPGLAPHEEHEKSMRDPKAKEWREKNRYPDMVTMVRNLPKEELENALREGIKLMEEALTREPYKELGFMQVTSDQITVVNPDNFEEKPK